MITLDVNLNAYSTELAVLNKKLEPVKSFVRRGEVIIPE